MASGDISLCLLGNAGVNDVDHALRHRLHLRHCRHVYLIFLDKMNLSVYNSSQ